MSAAMTNIASRAVGAHDGLQPGATRLKKQVQS